MSCAAAAFLLGSSGALAAPECSVRSGPYKNALLELYTSEGCSSCPPADRWLRSINPATAQPMIIPIAFHVSYWDYIGWKDPYADARFTERQRAFAAGRGYVYTPQIVLGGKDFAGWRGADANRAISAVSKAPADATVELTQLRAPGAITTLVKVDVSSSRKADDLALVVVLTEGHLSSRITAGENRGASLEHDHVARDMASRHVKRGDEYRFMFEAKPTWKRENLALVAFIQDSRTGEVLQAISSAVCR